MASGDSLDNEEQWIASGVALKCLVGAVGTAELTVGCAGVCDVWRVGEGCLSRRRGGCSRKGRPDERNAGQDAQLPPDDVKDGLSLYVVDGL